jgi:hypothetical protein
MKPNHLTCIHHFPSFALGGTLGLYQQVTTHDSFRLRPREQETCPIPSNWIVPLQSFRFASQWPKYWLHPSFVVLAKFIASNPDEENVTGASNTSVLNSGAGFGAGSQWSFGVCEQ